jgi:hypothetical protein
VWVAWCGSGCECVGVSGETYLLNVDAAKAHTSTSTTYLSAYYYSYQQQSSDEEQSRESDVVSQPER